MRLTGTSAQAYCCHLEIVALLCNIVQFINLLISYSAFSKTTLSIQGLDVTLSINDTQHKIATIMLRVC
jgi:hypothetical protein